MTGSCSATVVDAAGRSRRCRLRATDGGYCHHHGGNTRPPTDPCTTCWSRSWEPVAFDTPGAIPHRGGHIRCALCYATDRAVAASGVIREALVAAERGSLVDVIRILRGGVDPSADPSGP